MQPLLILADDLTGAADTAARCHHAGLPATIYLQAPPPPPPDSATAFTSDSRHLSPTAAAERVHQLVAPLRAYRARWYKKIDSTLRGNLGSELDACMDALGAPIAVVCPAFPAQDRGLLEGYLVAPNLPSTSLHLPSLLRRQSRRTVASVPLAAVRSDTLADRLLAARRQGISILVIDAIEESDLERILAAVDFVMADALLCGSAGLISALALGQSHRREPNRAEMPAAVDHTAEKQQDWIRAIVIAGSGNPIAHRQIQTLAGLPVELILVDGTASPASLVERSHRSGPVWLLHLPPPGPGIRLDGPEARQQAEHLGNAAIAFIAHVRPDLLILSGGDTAQIVLTRLGVTRLTVLVELLVGMPLCEAVTGDGHRIYVIMKPGSFGDDRTLITLLERATSVLGPAQAC